MKFNPLLFDMKKSILCLILFAGITVSCLDIEKINETCEVYIVMDDGSVRFYEISEDVRRNKATGVFTYRDESGRLWSINQDPETGEWYSKSTDERPRLVERIVCGEKTFLEPEEEEEG
ncbi:hypothetical protein B879_01436 [Cecembia lonarensis LW9]|uniref:Uncharacterized protein n=2 Tax=Cecembia TaxID=1187078 RepID=K1M0L8_CECL9|nr:hypothetical protein B879_01436 [Cecembia lonarensis LW9]